MIESLLKSSVTLRMFIIAGLTLFLFIPTLLVESLITERQTRRNEVVAEVSSSWGGAQTLAGPILSIPFKELSTDEKTGASFTIRYAHFLPAEVSIKGKLQPELRYRGIYEVPLYNAQFMVSGNFASPDFSKLMASPDNVLWSDAFVTFGITDLNGIRDTIALRWNDALYPSEPGVLSDDVLEAGITFKPAISAGESSYAFSFPLNLNGSSEVRFVPAGAVTGVALESPWRDPSFTGSFLPHIRNITAEGFQAEWKILNLNRNFPQAWIGSRYDVVKSSFGTSLYLPVDEYQKTSRAVKYAMLFIVLTFASFFLSEVIAKTNFHPIQYILIGFALILFYVLLLSLSEHMRFNTAYLIATAGVVALVTAYAYWISVKRAFALVIFMVLAALYSFLFVILQLQDYALLLGSIGLFAVLSLIMYLTRSIDWFAVNRTQNTN